MNASSQAATEATINQRFAEIFVDGWSRCEARAFTDHTGTDKIIGYRRCTFGKGSRPVIVVPGFTEPAVRYMELVDDLGRALPNLGPWYLLDLPGQGASGRLSEDKWLVHLDDPGRFQSSFSTLVRDVVQRENGGAKPFVIAHSTGALEVMSSLRGDSSLASGFVFSAPLVQLKLPLPLGLARRVAQMFCAIGKCISPAWTKAPRPTGSWTFESNRTTSSPARFAITQKISEFYPQYYTSGLSWGWLGGVIELDDQLLRSERPLNIPGLMLLAGDDQYVETSSAQALCRKSRDCRPMVFESSRHEIFQERDSIRDRALAETIRFLGSH